MGDQDMELSSDQSDAAAEQALIVRFGMAMTIAGESIDEVGERLTQLADARGVRDISVVVLPTALFVQTAEAGTVRVQLDAFPNRHLRLDQIGDLYDLLHRAEARDLDALDALDEIDRILGSAPMYGPLVRTLGIGVLSIGFALTLQPTPEDVAIAFVLGVFVGLLRLLRVPGLQAVLPVLATFAVAALVFSTTDDIGGTNPLRTLIPPLVTFLPGAVLTTGMRDLSSGQVVSGSSRLVQGIVVLALLAFGIVAAATLVGAPPTHLLDRPV
ncbi:MAG TPA: threonine/serine exporter family protein, partial [Ilumatobacteraceae bacterium]